MKAPILHIIDGHTHFQNALLLKGESARHVWDAFIECWSTLYNGYPRKIQIFKGPIFASEKCKEWTNMAGINMEFSRIESPNSNGLVEQYYDLLWNIYSCIVQDYPKLYPEIAFRCAIKGINDTMGPEGLVPSYLVFGVIPSFPAFNTNLPEQMDRMDAISFPKREMVQVASRLRVQYALRSKLPSATDYPFQPGQSV